MGKRIAILAASVCLAMPAYAGLTNVNFEPFAEIGTLTSINVGKLGIISGTFYERAVGPSTNGGAGWSANLRGGNNYHSTGVTNVSAQTCGMAGAWFYFKSYTIVPAHTAILVALCKVSFNGVYTAIRLDENGSINLFGGAAVQTGVWTVPLKTWVWMAQSWTNSGAGAYTVKSYAMTNGGSLFQLGTNAVGTGTTATLFAVGGSWDTGGTSSFVGRYGMPSIYAMGSLSDAAYPSDLVAPPVQPYTWYVNQGTGSDSNTGLAGAPWQTVLKYNQEAQNGGLFSSASTLCGAGDTVVFDNTTPLDFGTNQLFLASSGTRAIFTNGWVKTYATLASTNWTKTAGLTNIWETTDGSAPDLIGAVVWEDDKWMTKPYGASFAAIQNTMDTNAGSFFSDGTKVYVHPFANTDPTSDGKTYTRSRNRSTPNGTSAVDITSSNIWVDGLQISKTCLARASDGDAYNGYGLQWDTGCGGTNLVSNFIVTYFSKHGLGATSGSLTNFSCVRSNGWYGPGTPYAGFGGQSADVDYALGGSNNTYAYYNVTSLTNAGSIGGYGGFSSGAQFWVSHGSGRPFNGGLFQNSYVVGDIGDQGVNSGTILLTNSTFGYGAFFSDFSAQRCATLRGPIAQQSTTNTGIVLNSILNVDANVGPAYVLGLAGTQTVAGCTINMAPLSNVGGFRAPWGKIGKTTFSYTNNVFLVTPSSDFSLLAGFSTNDVLSLKNNVYQTGSTNFIAYLYYDGSTTNMRTFSQWTALGFDAGSVNQNACVGASLRPYAKTPCWNVGAEIGPLTDYTGKLFQSRRTAGAYEYAPPVKFKRYF